MGAVVVLGLQPREQMPQVPLLGVRPVLAVPPAPTARAWQPDNAPASCSWLNFVECFFSVITRQAIRRCTFTSVSDLISAIGAFTGHWNDHPHSFTWTKDADEILASIQRAKTKTNSFTRH